MDIDTWRVVEAQDRRVLREQHLLTCQDSKQSVPESSIELSPAFFRRVQLR
jgi:hypothetical protein